MKAVIYVLAGIMLSSALAVSCGQQAPGPTSPGRTRYPPELEDSEVAYLDKMNGLADMISNSVGPSGVSILWDASILWDDEHKASFAAEAATRRAVVEELRELEPTPRYTEFHRLIVEGFEEHVAADDIEAWAIDTLDPSLLDQALERRKTADQKLREALDLLERLEGEQ